MKKPTITIDGKTYEFPRPKYGVWYKLLEFDKNHHDIFEEGILEKRCEFIAELYGGVFTANDLLDNLYLDEIIAAYGSCVDFLLNIIQGKYAEIEKNADAGGKTIK